MCIIVTTLRRLCPAYQLKNASTISAIVQLPNSDVTNCKPNTYNYLFCVIGISITTSVPCPSAEIHLN